MPTIKLTDNEFEHIRAFYTNELAEAIKYVEQVKNLISKLKIKDIPKGTKPAPTKDDIQPVNKRGRKPAVKVEPIDTEVSQPQPLVRKTKTPKIGAATPAIESPKKRGRKPAVNVDTVKTIESMPKVREKRGAGKKVVEPKKILLEIPSEVPVEKIAIDVKREKPAVPVAPKPKSKRKSNYRRKGVYLTNLSKPLPKKPIEPRDDATDATTEIT